MSTPTVTQDQPVTASARLRVLAHFLDTHVQRDVSIHRVDEDGARFNLHHPATLTTLLDLSAKAGGSLTACHFVQGGREAVLVYLNTIYRGLPLSVSCVLSDATADAVLAAVPGLMVAEEHVLVPFSFATARRVAGPDA